MTLHLYDTAARGVREFIPLTPGKVGIYLCGATVQAPPHIGHLRPAVVFDILRRWLIRSGHEVTLIRNVTDLDDKILAKAAQAGVPWWAHAQRYEREFAAVYDAIGVLPPTYEPRATQHITDMIALTQRIIDRGHAYAGLPGNVYFDVRSFPEYGELTRQRVGDLAPAEDADDVGDKHDPHDFALWKAPKPGEPATASWPTPWGQARPGWHLECSAMSWRYLGETFDIHGGGLDLRFPHHENEQAQSWGAGLGFARYWMHNGWITQAGVKMSKSLGNSLFAAQLLAEYEPVVLRYALSGGQYRSMVEFSGETMAEAAAAWERIVNFAGRAADRVGQPDDTAVAGAELPGDFVEALDDDLNVPGALAVVHEWVRAGNTALADSDDAASAADLLAVRAMLDVLGLDPASSQWVQRSNGQAKTEAALNALAEGELARRAEARAARDFATADAIRDQLAAAGIAVEDGPDGARWSLN